MIQNFIFIEIDDSLCKWLTFVVSENLKQTKFVATNIKYQNVSRIVVFKQCWEYCLSVYFSDGQLSYSLDYLWVKLCHEIVSHVTLHQQDVLFWTQILENFHQDRNVAALKLF